MQSGVSINPRTGKEIRILQTEGVLYKDKKVLQWKEGRGAWDTISCKPISDIWLAIDEDAKENFLEKTKQVKLVFVKKSLLKSYSIDFLKANKIQNLICLEEMHDLFPQLGLPWNGNQDDAVILIAALLRYQSISGLVEWNERATLLTIREERLPPPQLWWVTQYYVPPKAKRRREIHTCLQKNMESHWIDKIVLLNERKEDLPASDKIVEHVIGKRLTYADVFEKASTFPPNVIVAFANADICIDDTTWRQVWQIDLTDKALALLRYDIDEEGKPTLFGPRSDSQDCWVMSSDAIRARRDALVRAANIPFGKAGCDNAIALELLRQRFLVSNPSLSIRTFHYHSSQVRNYDPADIVDKPAYLYVNPSGLHDLLPLTKGLKVEKDGTFQVQNAFVTDTGLVFDREKMYIGPSEEAQKVWGHAMVHAVTPSMEVQKGLVVPFVEEDMKVRERFVLHVLARTLRLRQTHEGDFICPESFSNILSMFHWGAPSIPVLRWEKGMQLWCRSVVATPVTEYASVTGEDVEVLRNGLRGWSPEIDGEKRLVIVEGEGVLAEELEAYLEQHMEIKVVYVGRSSVERIADVLRGAWGVVCGGSLESWGWNWMLPRGAYVFEKGVLKGAATLAASAGHYYRISATSKGLLEDIQSAMGVQVGLPVVWLPSKKEGYFHHAGDSFREMANLWAKAGFCEVREHPTAVQCWWGSVGQQGVLLYDRPTHEWRLSAPQEERDYKLALFGNPKPPSNGNGKSWFFWPRKPELVEELAHGEQKGFGERKEGVVFYGKIENRVQAKRRQGAEWKDACTPGEWYMAASADEPYPFTQKEYIQNLGAARFGLCLAGYGLKCHREVECMAMGCVPLVAPECDMDSYAEPPVEGVHYIRVGTPEEAKKIAAETDQETWEAMSAAGRAWWKRCCSCAGSFALTQRLINEPISAPNSFEFSNA